MAATIARRPEVAVARLDALFVDQYVHAAVPTQPANYDVFPNSHEFVMVQGGSESVLFAIVNWFEVLRPQTAPTSAGR